MERTDLVAQAVRLALVAGIAGSMCVSPATAQEEFPLRDDVAVQEKVTVTGTRIKRADVEGPLPITIITREDIENSGEISVAELLRTQTFNTSGSERQNVLSNVNAVDMRGLGSQYTLVLVNGRRIAGEGNLSMIPLAAVERIEVLRDGASAIYGTDAMAGVVNLILRRDYSGIHLSYEIGRPTQSGGDDDSYSITGGISGARGNVTFGMDAQKLDIVYQRDRDFTSEGLSQFGFPASYFAYLVTEDPRNPTGQFLSVGTFPDPRCPAELGSDADFPWSVEVPTEWGGSLCRYAWWGETATEASNDTKSFFVDANYEINDRAEFFARGLFSSNEVSSQLAPSPVEDMFMSPSAPQNPTNPDNPTNYRGDAFGGQSVDVDTDGDGLPDTTVEGPFDIAVLYRNLPGGNREGKWNDTLLDYTAGVRGTIDWLGGADWELAAQWSKVTSDFERSGEALRPLLQSEIDSGTFDIYGVFDPYGDDEVASATSASATSSSDYSHRITGGDGQLTFDAFQLDNGPVAVALGFEYRDEDYDTGFDEQSEAGAFPQGEQRGTSGARVVKSVFAETAIPVLSSLEVGIAGRYDDYNDFGTTINPKVTVAFRPMDTLLLRASYGKGFMAPAVDLLYEPPSWTGAEFIDSWRCSQTPEDLDGDGRADVDVDTLPKYHPCRNEWRGERNVWFSGNPDLDPEKSTNWTAGLVWSPTIDVSAVLDYFSIEINDQVWFEDVQPLLDQELALRQAGETGSTVGRVTRGQSGRIDRLFVTYENIDTSRTDGVDAEIRYAFTAGRAGDLKATLRWTHVFSYERDYRDGQGSQDWTGRVGFAEDRGQLTVDWNLGNYSAAIIGNYISDQDEGSPNWGVEGEHFGSFTTWDVQASYSTPWNGQITVGARNVFDRDPPVSSAPGWGYDSWQYEVYGRVPYLRLEQDF